MLFYEFINIMIIIFHLHIYRLLLKYQEFYDYDAFGGLYTTYLY